MRLIRNMWCFTGSGLGFILQQHVERLQKAEKKYEGVRRRKKEEKMTVDSWQDVSGDERRL